MSELDQAIQNLINAIDELEKRNAAKALGAAIGNAVGTSAALWRSDEWCDTATLAEIDAWGTACVEYEWPGEGDAS